MISWPVPSCVRPSGQRHRVSVMADIATPSGPDAELIQFCGRLVVNRRLEASAFETIRDEEERDIITAPINEEWHQLADRITNLDSPRTPEGARAMALAAMAEVPRNLDDSIHFTELH